MRGRFIVRLLHEQREELLRKQAHAQTIVSNSDRMVVNANLDAAGSRDPGLITISRHDVHHGKPGAELYLGAAWLLEIDPRNCLVVEAR